LQPTCLPQGRILVTGAAGFIGSALIWALNCAGHTDILACDRLDSGDRFRNIVPLRFHDYIEADDLIATAERHGLKHFGDIRTVIHLGACSATTERDALFLLRNNYEYSKALAALSLAAEARFVYASSAATYGGLEGALDDRSDLHTLRPLNMYAYSKQLFDTYALAHGWFDQIAGVKYFNVFGPNEGHKGDMRSVVSKAFDQIAEKGGVSLFKSYRPEFADGEQCRDFVYVKDAVDATLFLAGTPSANGLFNVGSGKASTWNELVAHVFAALQKTPDIQYIDMPEGLRNAYQYHTCAVLDRLRAAGYTKPMMSLGAAISDYMTYLSRGALLDPLESAIA
jgi:ADP-L-glycero-D-manno-heptose 6-epimerase